MAAKSIANKVLTLAFVREANNILLGYKKRGFGMGRWNGFGGKVQHGETIEDAAKRELHEECGLTATSLRNVGLLMFEFLGDPQLLEVHVFTTTNFTGTPEESEEMRPQWYDVSDIPHKKMWSDDILWFPSMLKDQHFYGYFKFQGMETIVDFSLQEVKDVTSLSIPSGPQPTCG